MLSSETVVGPQSSVVLACSVRRLLMSAAPKIRPATPADVTAIGKLGALLVKPHHDFDQRRFLPVTSRTAEGYGGFLGSQLDDPNIIILVAERDGAVLGYTYAGVEGNDYMALRGPAGVVYDIIIDPAYRRQGVGRMLLDATME